MSGAAGQTTHVSPSVFRQPGAVGSSDERWTRRRGRDLSRTNITYTGLIFSPDHSTPRGPNVEKDLPRIPLTPTELWDTESATVSSEMSSPVTSPKPSRPPLPGPQNLIPITEAQEIVARYRQRDCSLGALRSEGCCLPTLEAGLFATTSDVCLFVRSGYEPTTRGQVPSEPTTLVPSNEEHPSMNSGPEILSSLPVTPTIRRPFAQEVDIAATFYEARGLERIDQDGLFPCSRRDCRGILPTRKAYDLHVRVHEIHEGLRFCGSCGMKFTDDEHKDDHLNSCPKLPTFHDIESFNNEPPASPLKNLLSRFHL